MYAGSNAKKSKQIKDSSKYPQGYFKDKPCGKCKLDFKPHAPSEKYCSDGCKDHAAADGYLKRVYGLDFNEYKLLLESQDNKCKLCLGEGFTMKKSHKVKLVVDHCHTTGKVRGLPCHNCNRALGLLKDNKDTIQRALAYLD